MWKAAGPCKIAYYFHLSKGYIRNITTKIKKLNRNKLCSHVLSKAIYTGCPEKCPMCKLHEKQSYFQKLGHKLVLIYCGQ